MQVLTPLFSLAKSLLVMKNIFLILAGILGIGLIIAVHEFGHFIFCKIFNVYTPTFSIGMGPKIFSKTWRGTEFTLSALPIGGYVAMAQEGDDSATYPDPKNFFNAKPYWQKFLIMIGGILFNLIFAYVTLIILYTSGMPNSPFAFPENTKPIVVSVLKESPAETAGLQPHDRIVSLNNQPIHDDIVTLYSLLKDLANQTVPLTLERDGNLIETSIAIGEKKFGKIAIGHLGIVLQTSDVAPQPLLTSITRGLTKTYDFFVGTIRIFASMFKQRSTERLGGPLMVISQTAEHAGKGLKIFLIFLALFSINLAVLNLIPLPILDGGQILFHSIEALIRRPLPIRIKELIHYITWAILLGLMLFLTFRDIGFLKRNQSHNISTKDGQ